MATLAKQHQHSIAPSEASPQQTVFVDTGAKKGPLGVTQRHPFRKSQTDFQLMPDETEDSRITGGTRSLPRRLLALNLEGSLPKVKPGAEQVLPSTVLSASTRIA